MGQKKVSPKGMKCLSFQQPYAAMIAAGIKTVVHRAPARQGDGQLFLHGFNTGSDRNPF
jgi:hypothetical protein